MITITTQEHENQLTSQFYFSKPRVTAQTRRENRKAKTESADRYSKPNSANRNTPHPTKHHPRARGKSQHSFGRQRIYHWHHRHSRKSPPCLCRHRLGPIARGIRNNLLVQNYLSFYGSLCQYDHQLYSHQHYRIYWLIDYYQ